MDSLKLSSSGLPFFPPFVFLRIDQLCYLGYFFSSFCKLVSAIASRHISHANNTCERYLRVVSGLLF